MSDKVQINAPTFPILDPVTAASIFAITLTTLAVSIPFIDYYFAKRRAKFFWSRWSAIAQSLIKMELVKPSQVSPALQKKYLAAASEQITRLSNAELARQYQNQDIFHIDGLPLPPTLPRTKQDFEEKQDLVTKTLSDKLLQPLANIIDGYSILPAKLNLCVDDLEYYFLSSGLIEIKFSQQFASEHKLHIFYRGDPLLLTVPKEVVKGHCGRRDEVVHHPHRRWRANCVCGSFFTIVPNNMPLGIERSQLEKNLQFIVSSSWMPADLTSSSLAIKRNGPLKYVSIEIDDTLPWTEQLQRESKFVTIEFTSVGLSISAHNNTPSYTCPNLKFVEAESTAAADLV